MAIATAAKQIISDGMTVTVGGGLESISLVQNENMNLHRGVDPWLMENIPATYMSMLETAEVVSQRYDVSRDAQDEFALQSQMRTAAPQHLKVYRHLSLFSKVANKSRKASLLLLAMPHNFQMAHLLLF